MHVKGSFKERERSEKINGIWNKSCKTGQQNQLKYSDI